MSVSALVVEFSSEDRETESSVRCGNIPLAEFVLQVVEVVVGNR